MSTLTIRLPDDKHERLKALAKSNSISICNSHPRRNDVIDHSWEFINAKYSDVTELNL